MASLDSPSLSGANSTGPGQYSLRHVEPVIKRFITVLQIDADRLQKHSSNISKVRSQSTRFVFIDSTQIGSYPTLCIWTACCVYVCVMCYM